MPDAHSNTMSADAASGRDAHGNPITGDRSTTDLYDRAVDRLLRYDPEVLELVGQLAGSATPMAQAFVAYLHLMSTDAADLPTARACASALAAARPNEREALHGRAIESWAAGDWVGAARLLDEVLFRWPTDLLALLLGHQLDFFVGDAESLRDRPSRTQRELDPDHPHASFVTGMAAFGLEESGRYPEALDAGLAAVAAHPEDVWAVHAVSHVHEMRGDVDAGIRFLTSGGGRWSTGNLFTVHNWWHLALFHLEAGEVERVLAIYDAEVHNATSDGVPLEMLDASVLLWRLSLDGVDVGSRCGPLSDAWVPKAAGDSWYVFNDVHAVMALLGAGRLADARQLIGRLEAGVASAPGTNGGMTVEVGLPVARALVAHAEGRHDDVVADLYPRRRRLHGFGGSHAQRDAVQRTLLDSALRSGRPALARALCDERLAQRESSVYTWRQLARARQQMGDAAGAEQAGRTAERHRARFAGVA